MLRLDRGHRPEASRVQCTGCPDHPLMHLHWPESTFETIFGNFYLRNLDNTGQTQSVHFGPAASILFHRPFYFVQHCYCCCCCYCTAAVTVVHQHQHQHGRVSSHPRSVHPWFHSTGVALLCVSYHRHTYTVPWFPMEETARQEQDRRHQVSALTLAPHCARPVPSASLG